MSPDRIARLLPAVYLSDPAALDGPLGAYLKAMAGLHRPAEQALAELDQTVDPLRTDPNFLPMLARWLDLDHYLDWPGGRPGEGSARFAAGVNRLKLLLAAGPWLRMQRGQPATLIAFLETATGVRGFTIDDGERPFHARINAPAAAAVYRDLVERIVAQERPAYVSFDIDFAGNGKSRAGDGDDA